MAFRMHRRAIGGSRPLHPMAHHHHHHHHGHHHGHGDGHEHGDHSHDAVTTAQDGLVDLFAAISPGAKALNTADASAPAAAALRPWSERHERLEPAVEADDEDMLLFVVPFSQRVRLRRVGVGGAQGDAQPGAMLVWPNGGAMDLADAEDTAGRATRIELARDEENAAAGYDLPARAFASCDSVAVAFTSRDGDTPCRVAWLGFMGRRDEFAAPGAVTAVYEAKANPADHARLRDEQRGQSSAF